MLRRSGSCLEVEVAWKLCVFLLGGPALLEKLALALKCASTTNLKRLYLYFCWSLASPYPRVCVYEHSIE